MPTLTDFAIANAWIVVPLALLVAVLCRVIRRPAAAHALWLLVLLKFLTPPLVKLPFLPATTAAAAPAQSPPPVQLEPPPFEIQTPFAPDDVALFEPAIGLEQSDTPRLSVAEPAAPPPAVRARPSWNPWNALSLLWAGGSLAMLAIVAFRVTRLVRLLRQAPSAGADLCAQVQALCAELGLRRAPRVCVISGHLTPFVWAFGTWSVLVVPRALWSRLDGEQRTALLLHELAHLRRGDPWVRWLEAVATCLYWWHPALWFARRGLHQAEEQCCDAWVVWARPKAARSYASALVDALEFLSESRQKPRLAPIGASGLGRLNLISRRITMIMTGNVPRRLSGWGFASVLGLSALCLPCLPTRAEQQKPSETAVVTYLNEALQTAADASQQPADPAGAADDIEDLRDAVELAESQVKIKQALMSRGKAQLEQAEATLARLKRHNGDRDSLDKATADVATADANMRVADAEEQEAELRLRQAIKRFQRAQESGETKRRPKVAEPRRGVTTTQTSAARQRVMNNLKQIGIALHNHADTHNNRFPPAAIRSKDGKPLLSWRVAILPYIEQDALYQQFKLDEPWDSDHNKALIEKMPPVYNVSGGAGTTSIRAPVGKDLLFKPDDDEGTALFEITDGTSNTIAAVVARNAIEWTRPEGDADAPNLDPTFLALFADGSVRHIKVDKPADLIAYFTRGGGEIIDPPADPAAVARDLENQVRMAKTLSDLKAEITKNQADRRAAVLEKYTKAKQQASEQAEAARGALEKARAALVTDPASERARHPEVFEVSRVNGPKLAETINNLKQIGLALHNYHDVNGHLPPAFTRDKDGKPLLSWRVAILPFIEQDALYREFHLDEPWDSDHNRTLIDKMPKVFGGSQTGYTGIVGWGTPGTVFDRGRKEGLKFADIPDGTSNTVAAVVGHERPWTMPEAGDELPLIANPFLALLCDGSVQTLDPRTKDEFYALFSVAGGEVVDLTRMRFQAPGGEDRLNLPRNLMLNDAAQAARQLEAAQQQIAALEATVAALRAEIAAMREEARKK